MLQKDMSMCRAMRVPVVVVLVIMVLEGNDPKASCDNMPGKGIVTSQSVGLIGSRVVKTKRWRMFMPIPTLPGEFHRSKVGDDAGERGWPI